MLVSDQSKPSRNSKPLILLVEDEQFLCRLLMKKLEISGFTVRQAFDGESGLQSVEQEKPDLILLDLLLPGIDGFEVLRRLKADERFKDIPIIVLSNLGEHVDIEKAKQIGAVEYLVKAQYAPDEILRKVQEYVHVR